jgi:hypothetical protein
MGEPPSLIGGVKSNISNSSPGVIDVIVGADGVVGGGGGDGATEVTLFSLNLLVGCGIT